MKAVIITSFGGPEVLKCEDRPIPDVCETDVLIKVHCAGLNYADLAQRRGRYAVPKDVPKDIPGLEVSGVVVKLGAKVRGIDEGNEVCALIGGGGYAEYVAADYRLCFKKPEDLTFEEAACIPEAFFTVWDNIFRRGKLRKGEKVLIHGGSGGIGTTAIKIAGMFGAIIFTTASTDVKCIACEKIGATRAVNHGLLDFEQEFRDIKFDLIIDMVGGEFINKNIRILNNDGRLVFINSMEGSNVCIDAWDIMRRRLIITGSTLRLRDINFKAQLAKSVREKLLPLANENKYRPVIDSVFPLCKAHMAHKYMEERKHIGKIALSLD